MSNDDFFIPLAKVGGAVGRGLIAGLAGTLAITLSQMIEMKITGRGNSEAPVKVAGKALGVEARGEAALQKEKDREAKNSKKEGKLKDEVAANKNKFGQIMHYAYGSCWGIARGVLDLAGLRGPAASLIHFGAVWGTELVMLPAADAAKPITKWTPKQIAVDVMHHAVYAVAAGAVYDAMPREKFPKKRKWNIF